jgi:predicted transcriptional regulator of viral defense system
MKSADMLKIIKDNFGSNTFTADDLRKITKQDPSLQSANMHQLIKKGLIYHVMKGLYLLKCK